MPSRHRQIGSWAAVMVTAGVVALPTAASAAPSAEPTGVEANYFAPPTYAAWSWGDNTSGQLGTGTLQDSAVPVPVTDLTGLGDVRAITGGNDTGYALRADGTVWAWGLNNVGQLGTGTFQDSAVPVQVLGLTGIRSIAAGETTAYAVRRDGTVWAWGSNTFGQLGNNTTANTTIPVQVLGLTGIRSIATGGGTTAYAVRRDGTVWAWGLNNVGQLGTGTFQDSAVPVQVLGLTGIRSIAAAVDTASAVDPAIDGSSAYAVRRDGTVWAWGSNTFGQLSNNTQLPSALPAAVPGLTEVRAITAGDGYALALRRDGTLWAWGRNDLGQLGTGLVIPFSLLPLPVSGMTGLLGAKAISAGGASAYALRWDGTAWSWGANSEGQLGTGIANVTLSTVPAPVLGVHGAQAIAGGTDHGYAIVSRWGL